MTLPAVFNALSILDSLQKQVLIQKVYSRLQELLTALKCAIEEIHVAMKVEKFKRYKSKIKLCASQLNKALPLLVEVVKVTQGPAHKEVTDFLLEKIRWCLLEVLRLFSGGGSEDDGEPSGMFVKMMDDVIATLQGAGAIDANFRKTIDELLCQALTIAKLSEREDYESISAGCKHVLTALSDLTDFTRSPSNTFKIDAVQSALEVVERRVNLAVLRLFLHLASDPNQPLKPITLKALDPHTKPRNVSDLAFDLDRLDTNCERIQLIGNFAVACSNDPTLKVEILCCLASIEFCENFFHSSAEDFYMEPNDLKKKGFFKFLVDEYQREMKALAHLIDCVVDTQTFVQVVLSDVTTLAEDIKTGVDSHIFNKRDGETFLSRCVRLLKHLNSLTEESILGTTGLSATKKEFENALAAYHSCLRKNQCNLRAMQEVLDWMDSALNVIRRIFYLFTVNNSSLQVTNTPLNKMRLRKTTFVSSVTFRTPPDTSVLKPYLARVEATPRMKSSLYVVTPKKTPRVYPDRFRTRNNISEILDNIHDFPDTFTSYASTKSNDEEKEEEYQQPAEPEDSSQLATSISSLDTQGRIEDILLLDDKINKLKMV